MGGEDGCSRRGLSPLSGLICETVNSIGQGNLYLSGKSHGIAVAVATMHGLRLMEASYTLSKHI